MRTLFLLIFACIAWTCTVSAQDTRICPQYGGLNTNYASATQWKHKAELVTYHYNEWAVGSDGRVKKMSRAYRHGLKNRNTGIGLLIGGGVALAGGIALLTDGATKIRRNGLFSGSGISSVGSFYEVYFGAAFTAAGVAMTIPGAVLLPRGTKQMKKAQERMANP